MRRIFTGFRVHARYPHRSARPAVSVVCFTFTIALLLLSAFPVAAQEENRAVLVIVHGDGSVVMQCVAFAEASISGAEMLVRSGLDLSVEASSMGATVCRIDGEGCTYPQQSCFCQCEGSPCVYWSYWQLTGGEWRYSNIGAGNATVRNGDVNGWRWGLGTVEKAEPPPDITFDEICTKDAPMIESAFTLSATLSVAEEGAIAKMATPLPAPAASQIAAASNMGQPDDLDTAPTPTAALGLLLGALIVLPFAAILAVWLRNRGRRREP
jgi:hypothetical protein